MTMFKHLLLPTLLASLYGNAALAQSVPPSLPAAGGAAAGTFAAPKIAYEKYTLPNGLDVILVENHTLPIAAVNLWYHVGPANEAPGLTGFAHLFEHMMFAATKHVPRGLADKLLEGAGATDSNGSTDFDRTNYFDTVPSNQLELALWTHSDRMGYLLDVLDQRALSNQQDVVRNERRQSFENRPYGIVEEALYHQLFPKTHPYYASVIGSHADIQSAKLADIRHFFTEYYRPNNASLVIVGDIDKAKTRALVAKYFGSFKRGSAVPKPEVPVPVITAERRQIVADRVELPRVFMGWLTSKAYAAGDADLAVAAQILAGGKSSRLYKSLVYDKQIAQDVNATQNSNALTSMFIVDVTARPGHTAPEVEAAIDAELAQMRNLGPSEKEVERARNTIETALLTQLEKVGGYGLANQLNQYNQYLGDPGYLGQDLARFQNVTPASVQRAMQAQLQNNARAVVYGVPGTQDLGPDVPTPPPLAAKGSSAKNAALNADQRWRYKIPQAAPQKSFTLPVGQSFQLANGLTVLHYYNPALPLVAAQVVIKSGSQANPVAKSGLASFTAHMLEEGTDSRSAPQIADEIAQLGGDLETGSSADASHADVTSLKSNFGAALDLLADVVQHPSFPETEVARQRKSREGELSQVRENAPAVASRVALGALYGPQHPYGYAELGTEQALKATTRADLQTFWQQHYVPANAALVVSGDIGTVELKALVEAKFGAWHAVPGMVAASAENSAIHTSEARLIVIDKPGAPQTALRMTTVGPDRKTPDFAALQVMNAALGGLFTSRLNTNLREEKGYTYGVRSGFAYRRLTGPFAISASVRTDVTGPAVFETFKEVRGMRDQALPAAELANARNSQVLSLPGQFETNRSISASLSNIFVYDLGLTYYRGLPQRFAAVTAGDVQAAAGKYLDPAKLIVIAVGDKKTIVPQLQKLKLAPLEYRDADGNLLK